MEIKYLTLEIIQECNQACQWCIRKQNWHDGGYLPFDRIKWIADKFPDIKALNILGLGEPLLHPEWDKICQYAGERGLMLSFTTNGELITDEIVGMLPEKVHLHLSLETLDPIRYKSLKGGSLQNALQGFVRYRAMRSDGQATVQALVTPQTKSDIASVAKFAGLVNAHFRVIYPIVFNLDDYGRYYPDTTSIQIKKLCDGVNNAVTIAMNGDIYPCTFIYENRSGGDWNDYSTGAADRVPQTDFRMGNIYTDDLDAVMKSEKWAKILEVANDPEPSQEHYCARCSNRRGRTC